MGRNPTTPLQIIRNVSFKVKSEENAGCLDTKLHRRLTHIMMRLLRRIRDSGDILFVKFYTNKFTRYDSPTYITL